MLNTMIYLPLRTTIFRFVLLVLLAGCTARPTPPASSLDLVPFQEMAASSQCSDLNNHLYLIDDQIVFWETTGNCADASYSLTLFDGAPDKVLCIFHDSIAGPQMDCLDPSYQEMFDTILAHSKEPDLGLGSTHTVEPIPF